ncbi:MAG: hypothetical protein JWP84_3186 [Tardiphaga sp.]|nr:hypothetical protein [Tardiphaga sp.]
MNADDLFSGLQPLQTRQQHTEAAFAKEIRFEYWKRPYVFKPFRSPEEGYIVGVIAKEHTVKVAGPPEEGFAAKEVEDWETANMLIDSQTSQLAAMQQGVVGDPLQIFRSLVDHINQNFKDSDWLIEVNPVTTKEEFWAVADRFKGHIAEVDLSFAVPNIWGGQSETEKALNELKNENNAQEVEVKIKNKDGQLNPDTDRVRASVDYITKGGGTVRLRDDTHSTIYSSEHEENAVATPIEPDFPIQQADVGMITSLIQRLFSI